jgi:dienelactone hydrolase
MAGLGGKRTLERHLHFAKIVGGVMIKRFFALLALVCLASCEPSSSSRLGQVVEIPTGHSTLRGVLWTPEGRGPFPAVLFNHGRPDTPDQHLRQRSAQALGPIFAEHGYVFLYLFRHGEGLSKREGRFIGEELAAEERLKGVAGRRRLQLQLQTGSHLNDGMAGITYLRQRADVDPSRVGAIGHSFGGSLALLEAERDHALRAVVTFGAAAGSWSGSPELRERMLRAVSNIEAPVFLIHAANDYSTQPGRDLAAEFDRLGKRYLLKIYPPFGKTPADGHSFFYRDPRWVRDVFNFLDAELMRSDNHAQ